MARADAAVAAQAFRAASALFAHLLASNHIKYLSRLLACCEDQPLNGRTRQATVLRRRPGGSADGDFRDELQKANVRRCPGTLVPDSGIDVHS